MHTYHFLLVNDLSSQELILGTLFLSMIMPIEKVDSSGISSIVQNQSIVFRFITQPNHKLINKLKDQIILKEQQINFLLKKIIIFLLRNSYRIFL